MEQRTGHTHAEARHAWPRSVKDFVTCSLDSTRHATKEGTRLRHQRQTRRDLRSRVSVLRTAGKHGRPRNDRRPQRLMRDLSIAHWYSRSREYAPRAPARNSTLPDAWACLSLKIGLPRPRRLNVSHSGARRQPERKPPSEEGCPEPRTARARRRAPECRSATSPGNGAAVPTRRHRLERQRCRAQ